MLIDLLHNHYEVYMTSERQDSNPGRVLSYHICAFLSTPEARLPACTANCGVVGNTSHSRGGKEAGREGEWKREGEKGKKEEGREKKKSINST